MLTDLRMELSEFRRVVDGRFQRIDERFIETVISILLGIGQFVK